MHLTQHTDYALRMLIYLGMGERRQATIAEVSALFQISRSHLMKIANQLVRDGFIEGVRGKGGGLRLKHPPGEINIGDVIRHTERDMTLVECFKAECTCLLMPDCILKEILQKAQKAFMHELSRYSLADLLKAPQTIMFNPSLTFQTVPALAPPEPIEA